MRRNRSKEALQLKATSSDLSFLAAFSDFFSGPVLIFLSVVTMEDIFVHRIAENENGLKQKGRTLKEQIEQEVKKKASESNFVSLRHHLLRRCLDAATEAGAAAAAATRFFTLAVAVIAAVLLPLPPLLPSIALVLASLGGKAASYSSPDLLHLASAAAGNLLNQSATVEALARLVRSPSGPSL